MAKAVFVLGSFEQDALEKNRALTARSEEMLQDLGVRHDLDVEVVFATQDEFLAGRNKQDIGIDVLREERPRVVQEVVSAAPDLVLCFGPVAAACVFDKGNLTEDDLMRREHRPFGEDGPPAFYTHSLEAVRRSPGLAQWLVLDMDAAVKGHTGTEWGDYTTLLPNYGWGYSWSHGPVELNNPYTTPLVVALDTETYPGLQYYHAQARLRMVQITDKGGRAWVVQADDSRLPDWVKCLCEDSQILKVGSNISYDAKWLRRFGINMVNFEDTSIREHIIDQSNPRNGLKFLSLKYWPEGGDYARGHKELMAQRIKEWNATHPKSQRRKKGDGWDLVRDDEQYQYAGGDADATIRTWEGQKKALLLLEKPRAISQRLNEVFLDIEFQGMRVDMDMNKRLDKEYRRYLQELCGELTHILGPINPNSPIQLARALVRAVPSIDLRPAMVARALDNPDEESEYSTANDVLEREKAKHPIIETVMTYRKYYKRHSTYIDKMVKDHVVEHHGHHFVHPDFKLSVTETYRPSSSEPNMLNIPRVDDKRPDLSVKQQFCSRFEGGKILDIDQSQIELRFAAWLSHDQLMIEALEAGGDIHQEMAAKLLRKKSDEVTDQERTECKERTFLILYGGGARKLSDSLHIAKKRAQQMINDYFCTYSGLRTYIDLLHARVRRDLYVETVFGFRRHFQKPPHWRHRDAWAILRQAFNTPVQNGAFWLMACGLMWIHAELQRQKLQSKMVLQVYDSIVIDTHPDEIEKVKDIARYGMEVASVTEAGKYGVDFTVPLRADIKIGDNWGKTS